MTQTITVKVADSRTRAPLPPRSLTARIYGHIAVHESTYDDTHTISHIPTGLAIAYSLSEQQAMKVARKIRRLDWQFADRDAVAKVTLGKLELAVTLAIIRVKAATLIGDIPNGK